MGSTDRFWDLTYRQFKKMFITPYRIRFIVEEYIVEIDIKLKITNAGLSYYYREI